ncbi:MAG: valine--tRNA ligase [Saprospiraceae bacterium]
MLSVKYSPSEIEDKWYSHWESKGYFHSEPDEREAFSIVIPPPNVTGVLHMGHMLNNTIQDILIRKARLDGKNACWVPGTDHASIATEAKVVKMLREKGIKKSDLTRDEFMKYAYEWKDKYGGIILGQLKRLGSSCDWERTAFTMDEQYSKDVIKVFVELYKRGKLYRDYRMVNWDPEAMTVLSNEEVLRNEEDAMLFYVRYKVEGTEDEWVTIATQRPETIMADTAVAVHPKDERYAHLKGKRVIVPLVNRSVPIIFDEYVELDFGTGALKVTPAHDPNDYELGKKHGLEVIASIDDDGKLNEKAVFFVGEDRFQARKSVRKALEASGNLVKTENYKTNIGRSERTGSVVEPMLSLQWYVDMKVLSEPALEAVMNDTIQFVPPQFKNTYKHWMGEIRDWCISRQLWWGHRIPAYYTELLTENDNQALIFVAETEAEAYEQYKAHPLYVEGGTLRQDDDVLDTWASSWLWPISVFNGFDPNSKDFAYYYPTSVLVTGWDIIFLWVARMAMAGFEFKGERPFEHVYFTGMVRDKNRKKMSKSLGNSPDALTLLDIYGADGVRFGMLATAPAGGDLIFDAPFDPVTKEVLNESQLCEQGRNFCNKMWNALRLLKGWEVVEQVETTEAGLVNELAANWMNQKIDKLLVQFDEDFKNFKLSECLMNLYKLIWDDFCSWYLEMIKPAYQKPIDKKTLESAIAIFERLLTVLHPFMPFITEEIWHQLRDRKEGNDICLERFPVALGFDEAFLGKIEGAKEVITKIRESRNSNGIKMAEKLNVVIQEDANTVAMYALEGLKEMVVKLANLQDFQFGVEPENAVSFISGAEKYYVEMEQKIDVEAEIKKIKEELIYQQGFMKSVDAKLSNERFVNGAPAQVLENERKKKADAESRIKILEESLQKLGV